MPSFATEKSSVQNPIIEYATQIGWSYLSPDDALRMRGGETGLILRDIFSSQVIRLNSDFANLETANIIIKRLENSITATIEGNEKAWQHLTGKGTVFISEERRDRNVKLIDFENPERNEYHVTDEMTFTNGVKTNRPDIVFFINGIPVFVLEAKAPHRIDGITDGLNQIRRYHEETPEMMVIPQAYQVTNIIDFYYGPTWNFSSKSLFAWRLENNDNLEDQVKSFFRRETVLNFIRDYILFARQDDELKKAVLRPHQASATEKVLDRSISPKSRGLIWHTQGSGKTYTMIVAAKKIMEHRLIKRPIILMLVDRNELESQLFSNLSALGFENVHVTDNKKELQGLLKSETSTIIVSTIQKFEGMPEKINLSKEIYVFADEAHRSTGGKLGNYLMGAVPNATFIGFTGTPISRSSGRNDTFLMFGRDDPDGYLDKYGIKQSIRDGTTLPLNYSLAPNRMLVDRDTLEKSFLKNAELAGVSDIETLNMIMEKQVTLRNMMKNADRMESIAKYLSEHFRSNVEPLGYKAFLVAVDRESCVMYKEQLDKYLPPSYSRVIISSGHNDIEKLRKYHTTEEQEREIRKAFRDPEKDPKILIVTEKLLTGFDAPILYCMYLDKPMRDHVLLQAIARINRPYESPNGKIKPAGLIIDFVGVFRRLKDALEFDSKDLADIEDVVQDIEVLKKSFSEEIAAMKAEYLDRLGENKPDKVVSEIVEMFGDENIRQKFYARWRDLEDKYNIISPDEFLRPHLNDFEKFARIFNILRMYYDNRQRPDLDLSEKTAQLVRKNTSIGEFKPPRSTYSISDETLSRIKADHKTDRERILSMINSILNEVAHNLLKQPYLISIGEKAELIAQMYGQGQESSENTAKELESLICKMNEASKEQNSLRMSPDIFSLYWFLKNKDIKESEKIATEMSSVFTKYSKWRTNSRQERDIRLELNRALASHGNSKDISQIQKNTEIAKEIIDRLKANGNGE
ncbi:MAG: type I restriction endonuclease subunit R [Thermoplasmata archaeon]